VTALPLEERVAVVRDRVNDYNLLASYSPLVSAVEGESE